MLEGFDFFAIPMNGFLEEKIIIGKQPGYGTLSPGPKNVSLNFENVSLNFERKPSKQLLLAFKLHYIQMRQYNSVYTPC